MCAPYTIVYPRTAYVGDLYTFTLFRQIFRQTVKFPYPDNDKSAPTVTIVIATHSWAGAPVVDKPQFTVDQYACSSSKIVRKIAPFEQSHAVTRLQPSRLPFLDFRENNSAMPKVIVRAIEQTTAESGRKYPNPTLLYIVAPTVQN